MKKSLDDIIFDTLTYIILAIISLVMLYPFMNVLAVSLSDYEGYLTNPMMIFPVNFTLSAIKEVFANDLIISSYGNTIFVTLTGVVIDLFLIIITAYPLSKQGFRGKQFFMWIIIFTMLFNGGLIPNFYLIKSLRLFDTHWAIILPRLMSAFNIILLKNFFENMPTELEESAKIDGATEIQILWKIILPLSKTILATLSLFIAVSFWNCFFEAIMYIRETKLWTLQLVLREIIISSNTEVLQATGNLAERGVTTSTSLKYATLIVAIVPIISIYPFLQRYFVKGVMVGAVKG